MLAVYSVLIAGALGTMGLPHVLVRFYTNPDGRAARRTTVAVLAMIGGFYIVAVLVGVLARLYTPDLLSTGETDAAVLLVPSAALGQGWTAWLLGGLVAAGTAAAFLSTSSGLVVSLAGVLFTDVLRGRWKDFRLAAVCSALLPIAMALTVKRLDFAAHGAARLRRGGLHVLPAAGVGHLVARADGPGAAAGVLVGGVLSTSAVLASLFVPLPEGVLGLLLYRPAIATVPAAFLTMVLVSRMTRSEMPADVDDVLLRLHAPERLGLTHDRV
jgi:Na+(H+)/acetate symporter ActP